MIFNISAIKVFMPNKRCSLLYFFPNIFTRILFICFQRFQFVLCDKVWETGSQQINNKPG